MRIFSGVGLILGLIFFTANASIENKLKCYSGIGIELESYIYCPTDQKFSCSVSILKLFLIVWLLSNSWISQSIALEKSINNTIIRGCLLTSLCQNSTNCCETDLCNRDDTISVKSEVSTTVQNYITQAKNTLKCYACKYCKENPKSWGVQECPEFYTCSVICILLLFLWNFIKSKIPSF